MSQQQEAGSKLISSLRLPHRINAALSDNGYKTVQDLSGINASELALELGIEVQEADEVVKSIRNSAAGSSLPTLAASQVNPHVGRATQPSSRLASQAPTVTARFSTFSDRIDSLIGIFLDTPPSPSRKGKEKAGAYGSVLPGVQLEISGPPGSGKTAMCTALALSARMGQWNTDSGAQPIVGEVLLIDTEGSMPPERLKRAAECSTRNTSLSPFDIIRGIHIMRIATQVQMVALLNTLDDWLAEHPSVNLVIIDTLSYHFRQPNLEMRTRSRMMELAKQQIGKATSIRNCAVVVANQLATKLLTAENKPANFDTGDRAVLMPQLGDSWTTPKTTRLILFRGGRGDDMRYAHATSSAGNRDAPWTRFDIDNEGLPCDPVETTDSSGQ
ncbi:putative DNA repair protein Rad51 [Papiliotrema laurentii]|uniref:DNA repair protein Rad51 n=1 Tax=Papiliotrema laurentii TaxID=5418 RepID=A0AAD9CZ70_PAPLA|nr:putative DNA repair protein Rad51 [Papiliotrema laurentii]